MIVPLATCSLLFFAGLGVGKFLNNKNEEAGVRVIYSIEKFKEKNMPYPSRAELVAIPDLLGDISEKRLLYRARYAYSLSNRQDSFDFSLQTFPVGFKQWNHLTSAWDDEIL